VATDSKNDRGAAKAHSPVATKSSPAAADTTLVVDIRSSLRRQSPRARYSDGRVSHLGNADARLASLAPAAGLKVAGARPARVEGGRRRGFSEADSEVGQFPEPLGCSALVGIGVGGPRTMENLFKFLHILAVIVWVGGVLTVNVLQVLTGKGHDRAAQASLLRLSDLYGRAVIAPAAALTLLTGLLRVEQIDVGYGTFWVAWGITAIVLSLALGATLIRVTNAELRRIAADTPADDQRWPTLQRRATILFAINLLLLLSAVWAMEFKPTL
jgi:uncharacterized membrane protein